MVAKTAKHTRVEFGKTLMTPSGEVYTGFKVSVDDGLPEVEKNYERERVVEILKQSPYKIIQHSNTNIEIST